MTSRVQRFQWNACAVGALALILIFTHYPYLDYPYYWDELGQFVPAALDIYRDGAWVPHSTLPNVHPPGVMAYLAGFWTVTGYSVRATRIAMMIVAAGGLVAAFHVGLRLARFAPVAVGLGTAVLLFCSPLFWSQSAMALLDMPAMAVTLVALVLFLDGRWLASALACTVLVLVKETSLVAPAVFGAWLLAERRIRPALFFLLPALALAAWLAVLYSQTGHLLGNAEFGDYNLRYPLHPVRLGVALLRRLHYILAANFHWVGAGLILFALRRRETYRSRGWILAATLFVAHVLAVTLLGGAALERYLLPAMPLFYAAVAAAWTELPLRVSTWVRIGMASGMIVCLAVNPPYSFPYENNLAWTDAVALHAQAAEYIEQKLPGRTVTTVWPLTDALRRPEFGYVSQRIETHGLPSFAASRVLSASPPPEVFVLYSRRWEPPLRVLNSPTVRKFLQNVYGEERSVTQNELQSRLEMQLVKRWTRRGQWVEVYVHPDNM